MGSLLRRYRHGDSVDQPLVLEDTVSGESYFYHADHLGSVVAVTDEDGFVASEYAYDAYGRREAITEGVEQPYAFTGREWDGESGLYYYRARYYDPMQGRFLSEDPIGFGGGDANLYRYVRGNPVNYVDPHGLFRIHGEWCGPDWTGGFDRPYGDLTEEERENVEPPIDDLDTCCETHDKKYARCRDAHPCDETARDQCFREADQQLSECAGSCEEGGLKRRGIEVYMRRRPPRPEPNHPLCRPMRQ